MKNSFQSEKSGGVLLTPLFFVCYTATRAITDIEIYCKFSRDNRVNKNRVIWEVIFCSRLPNRYFFRKKVGLTTKMVGKLQMAF